MALSKRKRTWHTDFMVNGQRFRQSLHTRIGAKHTPTRSSL
jgi:hypothetical protein